MAVSSAFTNLRYVFNEQSGNFNSENKKKSPEPKSGVYDGLSMVFIVFVILDSAAIEARCDELSSVYEILETVFLNLYVFSQIFTNYNGLFEYRDQNSHELYHCKYFYFINKISLRTQSLRQFVKHY